MIQVVDAETENSYILVAADTYIGLYHAQQSEWIGQINW